MHGQDPRFGGMSPIAVATIGPPRGRAGNRPVVVFAVLGLVVLAMLGLSVVNRAVRGPKTVSGHAYAVGDDQPQPSTVVGISSNRLLNPGRALTAVPCALPVVGRTAAQVEAFYRAALTCLGQAWQPALEAAAKPFNSPKLSVVDDPKAKCGKSPGEDEAIAFYCYRDRTIYMPHSRLARAAGESAPYHLAVLAHEYGHHVQALSGILTASATQESKAGEPEAMELSRRTELQANCFAGLFLKTETAALTQRFVTQAITSFGDTEDSDSHGTAKNQTAWAERGVTGASTAACDTWSADTDDVK
ncbi:neutral zinc metallopeptidase [Actinokineospora inagensis]|uniref:neutral zinc metallopeptidase n=1 Tax=Actinokineospora inagensis TaxID=103730 RepID=UPI000406850F|nr:neutral zinc metallopeptidase [Actinokineospora inagensis]